MDFLFLLLQMAGGQGESLVTLGDLEEQGETEEEDLILSRLKILAQESLPDGWIKWEVSRATKEEVFGDQIETTVLNKLSFALPTVGLAKAFDPDAGRLSEKAYRDIRVKLLDWSLTRALILGPPAIANRIRGSAARTEFFKEAVASLKPLLVTQKEADRILSGADVDVEAANRKRRSTSRFSDSQSKRAKVDVLEDRMENMFSLIMDKYSKVMDRLDEVVRRPLAPQPYEIEDEDDEVVDDEESDTDWQAPSLEYDMEAEESVLEEEDLDFRPRVKEADPLIPEPSPELMAEGIECQRLGSKKWSRIRFKDAEKKLQAAPVFNSLEINAELASLNLHSYPLLTKQDGILGTVCHGILLQRRALVEDLKNLVKKHPAAKDDVRRILKESQFQSVSDDLLQFTCGHRAETIEMRRKVYKTKHEVLTAALQQIPPSSTHLFEERSLVNFLKDNGGARNSQRPVVRAQKRSIHLQAETLRVVPRPLMACLDPDPVAPELNRKSTTTEPRNIVNFRGGQLRDYAPRWQQLGAPDHVMKILVGYTIPFVMKPPSISLREFLLRKFATEVSPLMSKEIKELQQLGVVELSTARVGFLSRLFLIPKSNGKVRQIFDLRRLNLYLKPRKFRLTNQSHIPKFLHPSDYLAKLDLSQAYIHVPIKESHKRYLCFAYAGKLYQLTCLPFGLSSAPLAFSRLTNWVASVLRLRGIRVLVYLDDFLFAHQNPHILENQVQFAVELLQSLGWVVNLEKSILKPTRQIEYLGIIWDTANNQKLLPQQKITSLSLDLQKIIENPVWDWKSGTSLIGKLGFGANVTPMGRLYTRNLQRASRILKEDTPHKKFPVPAQAIVDCLWWIQHLHSPGKLFVPDPTIFLTTDASDAGWGIQLGNHMLSGMWTSEQRLWHINRKEFFTVFIALSRFQTVVQGQSILLQSLQHTGRSSFQRNEPSRLASKRSDNATDFHEMGNPRDRSFCLLPIQGSPKICDTEAEFVNAFSQKWHFRLAWVFPPPPLIPKVLQHLDKASGVFLMVVPRWEKAFWRGTLKRRALEAPIQMENLDQHLIDLSSNRPPEKVAELRLEAWKIRGGVR
ncbi:reverse transcriptase (RNA-dependent DNA polymerase) domain-containing protein [Phthorimaea operculella]|nr:reverse transcriptase (RNA-dependent DNA polymerase) domain-containing protein [Phthorimaea operculella]